MLLRLRQHLKKSLPTFAIESLLIVFSILLAFFVNEWRETRSQKMRTAQALHNIETELSKNLESLESVLPYHNKIKIKLNALRTDPQTNAQPQSLFKLTLQAAPKSLMAPVLQNTAWETARATNALSQLDYDVIHKLATVYQTKKRGIDQTIPIIHNTVFNANSFDKSINPLPSLQHLFILISDMINQEKTLIHMHKEMLEILKKETQKLPKPKQ